MPFLIFSQESMNNYSYSGKELNEYNPHGDRFDWMKWRGDKVEATYNAFDPTLYNAQIE